MIGGAFAGTLRARARVVSSGGKADGFVARLSAAGEPALLARMGGLGTDGIRGRCGERSDRHRRHVAAGADLLGTALEVARARAPRRPTPSSPSSTPRRAARAGRPPSAARSTTRSPGSRSTPAGASSSRAPRDVVHVNESATCARTARATSSSRGGSPMAPRARRSSWAGVGSMARPRSWRPAVAADRKRSSARSSRARCAWAGREVASGRGERRVGCRGMAGKMAGKRRAGGRVDRGADGATVTGAWTAGGPGREVRSPRSPRCPAASWPGWRTRRAWASRRRGAARLPGPAPRGGPRAPPSRSARCASSSRRRRRRESSAAAAAARPRREPGTALPALSPPGRNCQLCDEDSLS